MVFILQLVFFDFVTRHVWSTFETYYWWALASDGITHTPKFRVNTKCYNWKQKRSTDGCSKFVLISQNITSSWETCLNIRTHASPKCDRTSCPEESTFGMSQALDMLSGNFWNFDTMVELGNKVQLSMRSRVCVMYDQCKVSLYMVMH